MPVTRIKPSSCNKSSRGAHTVGGWGLGASGLSGNSHSPSGMPPDKCAKAETDSGPPGEKGKPKRLPDTQD